ncbi:MAG: EamA family transporter [Bacteroidetes bacterium]|nr:EamA family transporter [Bacteroidota bacterium]
MVLYGCYSMSKIPTLMEFVYLILVGITTQLGQINMTRALQAEALGKVSIVQYIGIVFALIFGVLLFGETYTVLMLFGIAIIAASVVTNVLLAKS